MTKHWLWLLIMTMLSGLIQLSTAQTNSLDLDSPPNPFLDKVSAAADAADLSVVRNLNHPLLVHGPMRQLRLGAVADVPAGKQIDSSELEAWEASYALGSIGAIALVTVQIDNSDAISDSRTAEPARELWANWLQADSSQRAFISFAAIDAGAAERLFQQLQKNFPVWYLPALSPALSIEEPIEEDGDQQSMARFYATATHRWLIDSESARRYSGDIPEFNLLGMPTRGNSNSALGRPDREQRRITASEPDVFRKVSLGNEFEASTIPEIIVPGGIAFGETAVFDVEVESLHFIDNRLFIEDRDGSRWSLPEEDIASLKAWLDFAVRAERIDSDAVVDIDERGRVKLSAALRDTDAGYAMLVADTQPFNYIRYLPADKSIVIDNAIAFYEDANQSMQFHTDYEIRYLRADRQRLAQTRVALQYRYDEATGKSAYLDEWGTDMNRLRADSDYDVLGESTVDAARYAAWAALFRMVAELSLDFTDGRYEFMKTLKTGRATPARF